MSVLLNSMSSTKVVIIVLILVGVLFVIFVARGALRDEPKSKSDPKAAAKAQKPPGWTKSISELFSSKQPKLELKQKFYSATTEEEIKSVTTPAFRTARFHLVSGSATIEYKDVTPIQAKDLKDLQDQECPLPADFDSEHPDADRSRCSIVALKGGGTLTFACNGKSACRVAVE